MGMYEILMVAVSINEIIRRMRKGMVAISNSMSIVMRINSFDIIVA